MRTLCSAATVLSLCALISCATVNIEASPRVDVNAFGEVSICASNTPLTEVVLLINKAFAKQHSPPAFRIDLVFTNGWKETSDRFSVPISDSDWMEAGTDKALYEGRPVGIPKITIHEVDVSIARVLDEIVSSHEGIIKCRYTNNHAIMWPGLRGLNIGFHIPLPSDVRSRYDLSEYPLEVFDSRCSDGVTDIFLMRDDLKQMKFWSVSRNHGSVQDFGFCGLVSSNVVNYLCHAPSVPEERGFDRYRQGEAFLAVYATETSILGFRVISQKDVEKMPDLFKLLSLNSSVCPDRPLGALHKRDKRELSRSKNNNNE